MAKINCWEFKKCERQEDGEKTEDLGVCPASTETRLNGVHDGMNAGRSSSPGCLSWLIWGSVWFTGSL